MLSTKNTMLSTASADLGLGDGLKMQVENELAQRKKKLLANAGLGNPASSGLGGGVLGSAAASLLGGNNG